MGGELGSTQDCRILIVERHGEGGESGDVKADWKRAAQTLRRYKVRYWRAKCWAVGLRGTINSWLGVQKPKTRAGGFYVLDVVK